MILPTRRRRKPESAGACGDGRWMPAAALRKSAGAWVGPGLPARGCYVRVGVGSESAVLSRLLLSG